jgi:hypothetical protein
MIKASSVILMFLLFLNACARRQPSTHCYLKSGLYLITGDETSASAWADLEKSKWGPTGNVEHVFNFYNQGPRETFYEKASTLDNANAYLIDGYLVVVIYHSDGPSGFHSAPYYGQPLSDIGDDFESVNIDSLCVSFIPDR